MKFMLLAFAIAAAADAGTLTVTVQGIDDYHNFDGPALIVNLAGLDLSQPITFSTTSNCGFGYAGGCGPYSPFPSDSSADGDDNNAGGSFDANGITSAIAPYNSLIGVFLDASAPNSTYPPALDFTTGIGTAFTTLSPGLKQAFFIGDGLTGRGTGSVQTFFAPAGATRLFLGAQDGFGWNNNGGHQDVTLSFTGTAAVGAVPEPSTFLLLSGAFAAFALRRKLA